MPSKRFRWVDRYFKEYQRRFTREDLQAFFDKIMDLCQKNKPFDAHAIAKEGKYRTEWSVEETSTLRLASVVYFNLDEDVRDYDHDYNKEKIDLFKKKDMLVSIVKKLAGESHQISDLSEEDLKLFIVSLKQETERQNALTQQVNDGVNS